jgi:hypothetical protein
VPLVNEVDSLNRKVAHGIRLQTTRHENDGSAAFLQLFLEANDTTNVRLAGFAGACSIQRLLTCKLAQTRSMAA